MSINPLTQDLLNRLADAEGVLSELLDMGIAVHALHVTDAQLGLAPLLHVDDSAELARLPGYEQALREARRKHCLMPYRGCQLSFVIPDFATPQHTVKER